jgi:putative peptide-modifying radical SAM enzyme
MNEFDNGLGEKFKFDFNEPCVSNVDVSKLKGFLSKDKDAVLIFYGGEPLLQIDKIKEIMDKIKVHFRMQTNGILLDKLPSEYMNRISKILVSLDGGKERTDKNRGKGTYEKVMNNIKFIKDNGYTGEIVARMTIAQDCSDLYDQVISLVGAGFTSVHWQLDVGFYKEDFEKEKIKKFFEEYNKSISKLIEYWIKEIESGKVLKFYPFLAIVDSLLKGEPTKLRCGAGHSGYAIFTSGKVRACPIMNGLEDFNAGTLETNPKDLKKFNIAECDRCDTKDLCGGRCMYWRKAGLWPKEGDEMICDSIRFYIGKIKSILPRVKDSIKNKTVSEKDFEYERYFGPEIIP